MMKPALSNRGATVRCNLLGQQLRRLPTLILISLTGAFSIDAWNIGVCADRQSVPNIVLILADDLGWSDAGCYGGEIPTPNIDSLAAGGLRFTQIYNNAVCGPSRASLLTGLYCQQIGHRGDHWNQPTELSKCVMVSEVLKAAGYRTLIVGKWQERELPARLGYDRFFGAMCQAKISYFHEVQPNPFYLDEQRWTFPAKGFYLTDALTEHAVRFVEEAAAKQQGGRADSRSSSTRPTSRRTGRCTPWRPTSRRTASGIGNRAGMNGESVASIVKGNWD